MVCTDNFYLKKSSKIKFLYLFSETVVAESVVVIKKLLQSDPNIQHESIIIKMVHLLDHITVGAARAAILWLIGENRLHIYAPDVLRKCAKTFIQEVSKVI